MFYLEGKLVDIFSHTLKDKADNSGLSEVDLADPGDLAYITIFG